MPDVPLELVSELDLLDVHVHIGPEFVRRRYDVLTLTDELARHRIGAVLKNHFTPTTGLAALARARSGLELYGSVVLNHSVGGLNPEAVRAGLSANKSDPTHDRPDAQRIMVWFPSVHADAHLSYLGRDLLLEWGCPPEYSRDASELTGITVLSGGELSPDALAVLETVREHDLPLATCHLSAREVRAVVEAGTALGIRRLIVTHPFFQPTDLTVADQRAIAEQPGVFLEHSYVVHLFDGIAIEQYVDSIRTAGVERTILSTDLGQVSTRPVAEGWQHFIELLLAAGVTLEEIRTMASHNPRTLLHDADT